MAESGLGCLLMPCYSHRFPLSCPNSRSLAKLVSKRLDIESLSLYAQGEECIVRTYTTTADGTLMGFPTWESRLLVSEESILQRQGRKNASELSRRYRPATVWYTSVVMYKE